MPSFVSFKAEGKILIMCDKKTGHIILIEKEQVLKTYNEKLMTNDATWHASVLIHNLTFDLRFHRIEGGNDELKEALLGKVVLEDKTRIYIASNVSGTMAGLSCEGPEALAWHESGEAVQLV